MVFFQDGVYSGWCPFVIVSIWESPSEIESIRDRVQLGSCPFGNVFIGIVCKTPTKQHKKWQMQTYLHNFYASLCLQGHFYYIVKGRVNWLTSGPQLPIRIAAQSCLFD